MIHPLRVRGRVAGTAALTLLCFAQACSREAEIPGFDELPLWTATSASRIGSPDDPEFAFSRVSGLTLGPDGLIYSLHPEEPSIRRWTVDGRPSGRLGGGGSGPGEFESPFAMAWKADTLWVIDRNDSRITFFDTAGGTPGQISPRVSLPGSTEVAERYPPRPIGYLPDGFILSQTLAPSGEIAAGRLRELAYVRSRSDGTSRDTLAVVPIGTETILAVTTDRFGLYTDQHYSDGVLSLPTDDWSGLLLLDRKTADSPERGSFRLTRISLEGDTMFSRAYDYLPVAIDQAEADSVVSSTAESLQEGFGSRSNTTLAQWNAWIGEAFYRPPFYSPVESVVPGRDGTIWLSLNPARDEIRDWIVLSDGGDPLGKVRLPVGMRVMAVDDDRVWGVEMDELDVEYIVGYRLAKE